MSRERVVYTDDTAPSGNVGGSHCPVQNTDRELWRKSEGDYYSPSIHVTSNGMIGINCKGLVLVRSVEDWHKAMRIVDAVEGELRGEFGCYQDSKG